MEVNGTGTIRTTKGTLRDIFVFGYFKMFRWWFMVNQDVHHKDYVIVSEASTGQRLTDYCYPDVESAINGTLQFIEDKHYYFATSVGNQLVKYQCNLERRNTTNLQTIAIDSLLWNL